MNSDTKGKTCQCPGTIRSFGSDARLKDSYLPNGETIKGGRKPKTVYIVLFFFLLLDRNLFNSTALAVDSTVVVVVLVALELIEGRVLETEDNTDPVVVVVKDSGVS